MLKVYVAGKYSADNVVDVLRNIGHGRKVCAELFSLNFSPFCPWHDADFIIMNHAIDVNVQAFRDYCLDWLRVSDILLVISGATTSKGVIAEIDLAQALKIPIFYNIKSLLTFCDLIKLDDRRSYGMV